MVDDVRAECRGLVAQPPACWLETREEIAAVKVTRGRTVASYRLGVHVRDRVQGAIELGWKTLEEFVARCSDSASLERFGGGSLRVSELTGVAECSRYFVLCISTGRRIQLQPVSTYSMDQKISL